VWVQAKEIRKKYIPYGDKILRRGEKYSRRNRTCQLQLLEYARSLHILKLNIENKNLKI
jgi:hypothetical protein